MYLRGINIKRKNFIEFQNIQFKDYNYINKGSIKIIFFKFKKNNRRYNIKGRSNINFIIS